MKAAILVPTSLMSLIKGNSYHLALAHLVLANPGKLGPFYKTEVESGAFVILDNSVHELGAPLPVLELLKALGLTQASVLVAPDILYDASENLKAIRDFEEVAKGLKLQYPLLEIMGVPHGNYLKELLDNTRCLQDIEYLDMIGLPKTFPRLGLNRGQVAEDLGKKVHFLGIWDNPIEEVLQGKQVECVVGIDSSFPVRLALAGRTILEFFPTPKVIDFDLPRNAVVNLDWIKTQLDAYRYLVESDITSVAEFEQEYRNGRF